MSACVDDVECWMAANRLQLNHAKSEVLWCSSTRRQHQIPSHAVRIGSTGVQPVSAVRDLGIMLDAEVTMSTHVSAVVKASFAALRRIRSVRRSIPRRALLTLIQALVVSKVDYCNSVLTGSWRVQHPAKTVAVRIECCYKAGILGQKVRTHHSVTL